MLQAVVYFSQATPRPKSLRYLFRSDTVLTALFEKVGTYKFQERIQNGMGWVHSLSLQDTVALM